MPGDGGIQIPELAVAGHKALACAALLAGTSVEDHGSLKVALLDELLHRHGGSEGARAQQIVTAAVAVTAGDQGILPGHTGLLGQGGQGIILGENADLRASAAVGGGEGSGNISDLLPDLEALLFQELEIAFDRLVFVQAQLGVLPDLIGDGDELAGMGLNIIVNG